MYTPQKADSTADIRTNMFSDKLITERRLK